MKRREACAVESAARYNPNSIVFLLFASQRGVIKDNVEPEIEALRKYPNINMRNVDLAKYFRSTPAQHIFANDKLFDNMFYQSHMSDVLRYVTMFNHGGIQLDLDVIVQKQLDNIEVSFAGAESEDTIGGSVLFFDHELISRDLSTHSIM